MYSRFPSSFVPSVMTQTVGKSALFCFGVALSFSASTSLYTLMMREPSVIASSFNAESSLQVSPKSPCMWRASRLAALRPVA